MNRIEIEEITNEKFTFVIIDKNGINFEYANNYKIYNPYICGNK